MEHYTSLRTAQVCALAAFYIILILSDMIYAIFKMYNSRNVRVKHVSESAQKFFHPIREGNCIRIPSIVHM